MTGLSCPAKKNRAARSSSPLVPMYDPSTDNCFANKARRSMPTWGPVVAPHVTRRPPRASERMLFAHVASPTCSMTTSTPRRFVSRLNLRGDVLLVVVNDLVRAERPRAFQLFLRARRREHARAVHERDLDGRLADAAAGGQHQDVLAALQPGARHQHVPGGQERQRKRRRLDEVDVVGNRNEVLHRHLDELRVAAGMVAVPEHVVLRALVVAARQAGRAAAAAHAGLQHHAPADRHVGAPARRDATTSPATSLPEICGIGIVTCSSPRRSHRSR